MCLLALAGCAEHGAPLPTVPAPRVDGAKALAQTAAVVAIGPRASGSAGAKQTVEYLVAQCKAMGYTDVRVDEWTSQDTPHPPTTFRNVYASLPGQGDKFVLIGSHYDTKILPAAPGFVGANDGGSSTGLLLELMRVTAAQRRWSGLPLRFAFFDGEEAVERYTAYDGLQGSRHLAAALAASGEAKRCRAMLLLDMIGDRDLGLTLPADDNSVLLTALQQAAGPLGAKEQVGFYLNGTIFDDHVPFKELGIPALDLIDFNYGPGNSYWHTDQDTLDKLSAASLATVGDLTLAVLWRLR